jgi:tetratricopeptide (TPR) repeat protein
VDTQQCRACHAGIYRDYQNVGMARSFQSVPVELAEGTHEHTASGRHYQVLRREGRIIQRRYELDAQKREVNAFELEATHVIGSGNHARTLLHRTPAGEIIQLPLTWYSEKGSWAMSPGYDNAAPPDFTRRVDDSCLFCHNGYPRAAGKLAEGIDCQRCHGPGARHVELASKHRPDAAKVRASIVNPSRLNAELQMDVCMQCHLETTSAELPQMVRRFDRTPFSYRPGEPLGSYMIHFDHPQGTGYDEKFEIVGQAYRLRQSACFRESGGKLTCASCHNPHNVPRGAAAVSYYRAKCIACHSTVAVRNHPDLQSADCAACHMPKRRTEDAVHVVMTDHLVQRQPPPDLRRPLPERSAVYRGPLAVYLPNSLAAAERDAYLGVALVSGGADRQHGIALLEQASASGDLHPKALAVLGEGYLAEGKADEAIRVFRRALLGQPQLVKARYNLGQALEASGRVPDARAAFEKSAPDLPEAHYALANLLLHSGELADAEQHYLNAIRNRPVYAEAHNNLGNLYASQSRLDEARSQLDEALRINPAFAEAHNNLARVYASQNRMPEAIEQARRSVQLKPEYAEARYNLARLLQETGAAQAAFSEYRALLEAHPRMIEAHLAFGQALGDSGRLEAAVAEFREVLRLRPDHAEAKRNLDMALELIRKGER